MSRQEVTILITDAQRTGKSSLARIIEAELINRGYSNVSCRDERQVHPDQLKGWRGWSLPINIKTETTK